MPSADVDASTPLASEVFTPLRDAETDDDNGKTVVILEVAAFAEMIAAEVSLLYGAVTAAGVATLPATERAWPDAVFATTETV